MYVQQPNFLFSIFTSLFFLFLHIFSAIRSENAYFFTLCGNARAPAKKGEKQFKIQRCKLHATFSCCCCSFKSSFFVAACSDLALRTSEGPMACLHIWIYLTADLMQGYVLRVGRSHLKTGPKRNRFSELWSILLKFFAQPWHQDAFAFSVNKVKILSNVFEDQQLFHCLFA